MNLSKENAELRAMSAEQLAQKLDSLRRELFGLRLNSTVETVKDYSQFSKLRKSIARVLTHLNQHA